jgi:hypothetical protein
MDEDETKGEDSGVHDWVYVGTGDCGRANKAGDIAFSRAE